jgi:hypothetical protein
MWGLPLLYDDGMRGAWGSSHFIPGTLALRPLMIGTQLVSISSVVSSASVPVLKEALHEPTVSPNPYVLDHTPIPQSLSSFMDVVRWTYM